MTWALPKSWLVALMLGSVSAVAITAPTAAYAAAKKKKPAPTKKKKAAKGDGFDFGSAEGEAEVERTIKKEEGLAPKRDYGFDESIGKTKDLKKQMEEIASRPTLTPEEKAQAQAEVMVDEKLDEEIDLARKLLDFQSECEGWAPVRFRVGDLYWEKSKRSFFKSQDFNMKPADQDRYRQQMKKLQTLTIDNYKKIADECGEYKEYPKVLYYLGKALFELERGKDGAAYFQRIIKEYPDSEWVPNAWFMVGEYYFNTANDVNKALRSYKKAAEYPKSAIYGYAVYKQGWCYINTADWDLALDKFKEVISISEDRGNELDNKGKLGLRKEGLKDYVRSYSHVGEPKSAFADFMKVGGPKSVADMMEKLGQWYIASDAHREVIIVYRDLIKSFPKSTRLPIFQGRIVNAASRLDKKAAVEQAKRLTEYFKDVRTRAAKGELTEDEKSTIDKDLNEAEDIAENTLRRLAMDYHAEAKKLRGQTQERTYRLALDLYRHYLTIFPEPRKNADVNYVFFMRFYYAEVLYQLEEFLEAARNYDKVVAMNPTPKEAREKTIVLAAAEEAVRSYDELVQDLDRKNPPEIAGTEPKPIPQIKQDLISACQRYIQYVGSQGEKIVEIRYKMARIYYTYNHFDQAAPAFEDIVKNHPDNKVACYAANLTLDIYNGTQNYRGLQKASRTFSENKKLSCGDAERAKFAKIEQESTFKLIKTEYEDKKKFSDAAKAYMQFYKAFPQSELADDAVYNAAVNYDLGNRLDKANEVRRFLVEKIPDSPLVTDTLFNIAQSYERVVDFENAARYLDQFAKKYPSDKRSKDALYNAGLYRATLHEFGEAKETRDRYIAAYPSDPEIHEVAYSNCESLEREAEDLEKRSKNANAKWIEAHDCYARYIANKKYVAQDVDLLCEAQFRRGEIMRTKTNYAKGVQEIQDYLLKNWPNWKKRGVDKLPRCASAIAGIRFASLADDQKKYNGLLISELNPTDKGKKEFDASIKTKTVTRDKLVEQYKEVVEIGVAEWALAALFSIGELYRDSIVKLLKAPIPDKIPGYKLTDDDKNVLRKQLKDLTLPIEEQAVEAYRLCVGKAYELGVYNKWSVKALEHLQQLRPEEYSPLEERLTPFSVADKTVVSRNGLLAADGESLRPAKGTPPAAGGGDKPKGNATAQEP